MRLIKLLSAASIIAGLAFAGGAAAQGAKSKTASAILAGGCFWCVESDFDKVPGVLATTSGYIGGRTKNPTYKQVSRGGTGHAEVVKIDYDPAKISYQRILHIFWRTTDPLTAGGQFCDRGDQYRNAIFYADKAQKRAARASKAAVQKSGLLSGKIVTTIEKATTFYSAETYHQNYHKKNPTRYKFYRWNCGRDSRVKQMWGKEAYNY